MEICSAEILAHRTLFVLALGPMLGVWLPQLMLFVAFGIVSAVSQNTFGVATDGWLALAGPASFVLPVAIAISGLFRERRRLHDSDRDSVGAGIVIPAREHGVLAAHVRDIWRALGGDGEPPRIVCQPRFSVLAHAYEGVAGRIIEVTAGLAERVVRSDPLAMSILHHEVAHLRHGDLPALRGVSMAAQAMLAALKVSLLAGIFAVVFVLIAIDVVQFPLPVTLGNVVALHASLLVGAVVVALPLLVAMFIVRRYAGFIVALIETRADVSAGVWGPGRDEFARQIARDPTVRPGSMFERGLAYISPFLTHLPSRERVRLLSNPVRLATPKMGLFAMAVAATWLLPFHQGEQYWDTILLRGTIALIHGLAVFMVVSARGRLALPPLRALALALWLTAAQAIPFVSVEHFAYLAQHLSLAIVKDGGFGMQGGTDYWHDTVSTFREVGMNAWASLGGARVVFAIMLTAGGLSVLSRLRVRDGSRWERYRPTLVALAAACTSAAVSSLFFHRGLYRWVRRLAFASGPNEDGAYQGAWSLVPDAARRAMWSLSESLNGGPPLESQAWLRLTLPVLAAVCVGAMLLERRSAKR